MSPVRAGEDEYTRGGLASGLLLNAGRLLPGDGRLRILAYHAIADLRGDPVLGPFAVLPRVFARQLDSLLRTGHHFIDGDRLLGFLWNHKALPPKPILLTFDDCTRDLLEVALPILEARGIPAVAFAVAGLVGKSNAWEQPSGGTRLELLDAAGLRTLASRGVEIGAHGLTHRALVDVPDEELDSEVAGSLDALAGLGLPRPRFFAYPYGACNHRVFRAAVDAGLLAAFSVRPDVVDPRAGHFLLPRIVVFHRDRGWRLHWRLVQAGRRSWFGDRLRRLTRLPRRPGHVVRIMPQRAG